MRAKRRLSPWTWTWSWTAVALTLCGVARPVLAAPMAPSSAPAAANRVTRALEDLQGLMAAEGLDGWLLYQNEDQDPIAQTLVNPGLRQSRRWFYWVPRRGQPVALVSEIEAADFAEVPGERRTYSSWRDLDAGLKKLLAGAGRVAMDYSPMDAIPALSRVDAGMLERVRALGVEVVSSGDLVAVAESRWTEGQRISHYVAAHHLAMLKDQALAFIAGRLAHGRRVTERDVQELIVRGYAVRGLESDTPPEVAAGVHTALPHYAPPASGSAEIEPGDLILIDLWARLAPGAPGSGDERAPVYADMTWMAYAGAAVPDDEAKAFAVVRAARDKAVALVADRFAQGRPPRGYEVDDAARAVVSAAGFGADFIHRTGRSLDERVHGDGPNLDDYETHDTRLLQRGMGFSVEPGIYLPGKFGVRSEIDVYVGAKGVEIATPQQAAITPLLPAGGGAAGARAAAEPAR